MPGIDVETDVHSVESSTSRPQEVGHEKGPSANVTEQNDQQLPVNNWRTEVPLERPRSKRIKAWILTIGGILFALLYVGLGATVIYLDGKAVEEPAQTRLPEAIKYSVSVWPIMFGVFVAQTLRSLALWSAEKGTRMLTLEQIINSRSTGSAVFGPLQYGKLNLVGLGLIGIWLISPLAAQALQRISYTEANVRTSTIPLSYVDTITNSTAFQGVLSSWSTQIDQYNAIFTTSIVSSSATKLAATDAWGNPKVPFLEDFTTPADAGWFTLPDDVKSSDNSYSSLFGLPITGLPSSGGTQFVSKSAYFNLDCTPLVLKSEEELKNISGWVEPTTETASNNSSEPSMGTTTLWNSDGQLQSSLFIHFYYPNGTQPGSFLLSFLSVQNTTTTPGEEGITTSHFYYSSTTCTYDQTIAESHIVCEGIHCYVDKMRPATTDSSNGSPLLIFDNSLAGSNFLSNFGKASGTPDFRAPTIIEKYLYDPHSALYGKYGTQTDPLASVPIKVFTRRLEALFNTFWQTSNTLLYQVTGPVQTFPAIPAGVTLAAPTLSNTTGTFTAEGTVWASNNLMLGLLFFCCFVMILVAIFGHFISSRIIGPDILGYVSSVSRNNPYIPLPKGGSALDGVERAKLIGHVKVKLQDVNAGDEVGHIALSSVEKCDGVPLRKGRRYW